MGLFSKLKSSMNGGVDLHLQAPSSVAANQVIPVTVSITADSSQTITAVKAEIKAEAREQGFSMGGGGQGVGVQESRSMAQTVAQVESREPFTVGPGETKTVNLQLYINNAIGSGPLGQMGNMGGALGGVLQAVASAAQNLEHVDYMYSVHASADVQGHHMGPSDKQSIQVLPATAAAPAVQPTPFTGDALPPQPPTQAAPLPTPPVLPIQPPTDASAGPQL